MAKKPLGIYIHIPFCVSKCVYCDFNSFPCDDETKKAYLRAMKEEIKQFAILNKQYIADRKVGTIFFGGGTPTILPSHNIVDILNTIKDNFDVDYDAEITIECNPGTANESKLSTYLWAGINRLSLGLQSPNNQELRELGRIHTFEQFIEAYDTARLVGYKNINIDLMSGIPFQTVEGYERNLRTITALRPEHISAYSLILEEGTKLYDIVSKAKMKILPSEDEDREMYAITKKILGSLGYNRYEISNYAKSGFECKHNVSYWRQVDYIGFGISAASLMSGKRFTNTADIRSYIANPYGNYSEIRGLSDKDRMEEFMFLGLRNTSGISADDFKNTFGKDIDDVYHDVIKKHVEIGTLTVNGDRVFLTDRGLDVCNSVMADFLLDD